MFTRFLTMLSALTVAFPQAAEADTPPNVIVIFADDLGYGDVACFHSKSPFKTPRLDRMAAEGARFTSFYVPTPYCAPSRGTLLTGRYPFRHSVVRNPAPDVGESNFGLPADEITIAEMLKTKGYATAAYGKWHLGHKAQWLPRTQGFDEYLGILYSNDMYPVQLIENERVVEYPVVQATLTRRYTDRALSFIERHRDRPFFIYLPHAMPHKPLAASDDFYTPETRDDLYADTIAELDHEVGRVLDRLTELQLDRRTLVIFTSDNGPWYGGFTGGLRGMKGKTWEGGLRVPMIAWMPGTVKAGQVDERPAATIDILPTVAALTGARASNDRIIDGRNLLPRLEGTPETGPDRAIYGMMGPNLATIRSGRWKLHVRSPGPMRFNNLTDQALEGWIDPRGPDGVALLAPFEQPKPTAYPGLKTEGRPPERMLFDLETDPGETNDLSGRHPDIVMRLLAEFQAMEKQVPTFAPSKSDYLFRPPAKGQPRTLMRLIGGELRYDRVPAPQKHLLAD